MNTKDDEQRRREALRDIERVVEQSETIAGTSLGRLAAQARAHLAGADADAADPIEVWGRRIGRTIGAVAFVVLALYLVVTLAARWTG
ncbi:MAG TPA: hypothetical protein PLJ34_01245 [Hyphomicrobiales bacterium]|nr:hypothetical protein [Hyphomicrobiales bacterium]